MSVGMPEIGSKISLISKADIRYEGRLFTVDPQECTIALASVRSFGTEDRETQYPIAPQSQVYDYILFRGSDIKDIRVVNNVPPMPNDPAIMQMQLQNQMGGHQNFQPPQFVMGHGGPPPLGQFGSMYNSMGNMSGMGPGLAPGSMPAGLSKQKQPSELNVHGGGDSNGIQVGTPINFEHKDQASVLDMIGGMGGGGVGSGSGGGMGGGNSRSTTPISGLSRKSPTADMGVQVNNPRSSSRDNKKSNQYQQHQQQRQRMNNQKDNRNHHDPNKPQQHHDNRNNDNQKPNDMRSMQMGGGYNNHQRQNNHQPNRGWNRNNPRSRGRIRPQYDQQQTFRQQQGGNGGGGSGGGGGGNGPNQKRGQNKTIKFDSDYDFEQANNKFEELRLQLAKLKVAGGEDSKVEQVNGEVDKKDDSGNETGAGDNEHDEEVDVSVGYDKTKSFFDNISCEASVERNKGKNRTDWRQERKLNSETFGISSTRRGGFRGGRGGYFNRNQGGGGYRGGYRGNFRGRNNNQRPNLSGGNGMPQQQPQQQQQQPKPQPSATATASTDQ